MVLIRVNCVPTQCVNLCHQDFTLFGIFIRIPIDLYRDRRPAALKIWSCLFFFNEQEQNVKLKASMQQADNKNGCFSVDGVFLLATLSLKLWDPFITFAPVNKCVPSLTEADIQRGPKRRTGCVETDFYKTKRLHCYWNMGVWVVETTKQALESKNIWGKSFRTDVHLQNTISQKN